MDENSSVDLDLWPRPRTPGETSHSKRHLLVLSSAVFICERRTRPSRAAFFGIIASLFVMDLNGKTILVTGASSGIGRAVAICAASRGARLVLTGRKADALEETRRLCARADDHICLVGDLTDDSFVRTLAAAAVGDAPLYGLVHSAGVCPVVPLTALSSKSARQAFDVNCAAFLGLVGEVVRSRRLSEGFSVAAISSVSAREGWAGGTAYCASKGALSAAVRALETEFTPRGWRIRAFEPGPVATPLRARLASFGAERSSLATPESVAEEICSYLAG